MAFPPLIDDMIQSFNRKAQFFSKKKT